MKDAEFDALLQFQAEYTRLSEEAAALEGWAQQLEACFERYHRVSEIYAEQWSKWAQTPMSPEQLARLHSAASPELYSVLSEDGVWNVLVEVRAQMLYLLKKVAHHLD